MTAMTAVGIQAGVRSLLTMYNVKPERVFVVWSGDVSLCRVLITGTPHHMLPTVKEWIEGCGVKHVIVNIKQRR